MFADLLVLPAMQHGLTDHVWTISEPVTAALNLPSVELMQGRKVGGS